MLDEGLELKALALLWFRGLKKELGFRVQVCVESLAYSVQVWWLFRELPRGLK